MKLIIGAILVVFSGLSFSMRCSSDIIIEGDSEYKVVKSCGEPKYKSMDKWYYDFNDGAVYTVNIYNGVVTRIEFNRSGV